MDFQKLRKRRRRGIFLRRLLILAAIIGAGFALISLNNLLVRWQFPTMIVNFAQGFGGPGFPIRAPGGVLRDVTALGSDIAVLNDTSLHVYNRNGRERLGMQRISESTIMLSSGNRMLTYTFLGTDFAIHFQNRIVLEGQHAQPIRTAALGERGNYALVSSTWQFTSQVMVFDDRFDHPFSWGTSELVSIVALNPRGTQMAAGSVGARGGQLLSTVFLLDLFGAEEASARLELTGELILGLEYLSDTHIGIITDRGLRVMSAANGRLVNSYDITSGQLSLSRMSGGRILLLNEDPQYRAQTVILFGARGEELGRTSPQSAVRDIQVGSTGVYVLTAQGVARYDHTMNRTGKAEQTGILRILLAANTLYYFTDEEIGVLRIDVGQEEQTAAYQ